MEKQDKNEDEDRKDAYLNVDYRRRCEIHKSFEMLKIQRSASAIEAHFSKVLRFNTLQYCHTTSQHFTSSSDKAVTFLDAPS
uniref:Putative ovule protein n=1 Tax=Solanum chacoense TaxID=4108 RepID=A0A0V0I4M0_SOLCH